MAVSCDKMSNVGAHGSVPFFKISINLWPGTQPCAPTGLYSSFFLTLIKIAHFGKRFVKESVWQKQPPKRNRRSN